MYSFQITYIYHFFIIVQASATALMMAIYHGLSGVIEALLRAKPDVNITATGVCLCHTSIILYNVIQCYDNY